jgi:allophanate hydrolase
MSTRSLTVVEAGPSLTVQDAGRPGYLGEGLSRSGAADALALAEGAALLGQDAGLAAVEMAGMGGAFRASEDIRIALTGAPMRADIDGARLAWNASHLLPAGAVLRVGAAETGNYGYLHLGGGVSVPPVLGSRAAHLAAGLGRALQAGDSLPVGDDPGGKTGLTLEPAPRFGGGEVRITESMQTALFSDDTRARFEATDFNRDARANRMGVRLAFDGAPFAARGQLAILSEVIVPGDIQMTGDGTPFVLLPECQTTGGYPRIATVIPPDMARVAQAGAGAVLRFRFVDRDEGVAALSRHRAALADLPRTVRPLLRDPAQMPDLLSYHLIDGAVSAHDPDPEGDRQ